MERHWTLDQLRALVEVASTGSFTKAAESLSLSQPAVSVQIRSLEQAVGVQLFERRPRSVVLTDAGRVLERYARRILKMEAEFAAEIGDLQRLERGLLRVGAGATPSIFTLAGLFAEYYRRWPGVELQVRIGRTSELVSQVLEDELDLAIVASETPQEGLKRMPIYSERCVAIAGSGHPLADSREVSIGELPRFRFVMLPADSGFRRFLNRRLGEHGITLNAAMELSSLESIKEVVRTGVLVSIVPETAVAGESEQSGLRRVPITGAELVRQTCAIQRQDKYVSQAMKAFYGLIRERWPLAGRDAGPPAASPVAQASGKELETV